MTSSDTSISFQMNRSSSEEHYDTSTNKPSLNSYTDSKLQDVGCCGDVPKNSLKIKKRDKLLEWLKNSQLKREENNRQVFSRWIDMVDNGAIDLMSLSSYPGKPIKSNIYPNSNILNYNSVSTDVPVPSNDTINSTLTSKVTPNVSTKQTLPTNNYPAYVSPNNNFGYYQPNWFNGSGPLQPAAVYAPIQLSTQPNTMSLYPQGYGSYCGSNNNQLLGNFCQYVPMPQTCSLCPQYIMTNGPVIGSQMPDNGHLTNTQPINLNSTVLTNENSNSTQNSSVNIDVNKWFDILNEIKISNDKTDNVSDSQDNDCLN